MASFATPADLATYLGRDDFTEPVEYRQAEMLLDLASDQIRRWARQTISLVTNDTILLAGTYSAGLVLPERPVVAVASVAVDDTTLVEDSAYVVVGDVLYVGSSAHYDWPHRPGAAAGSGGTWGGPDVAIAVTYSHGFSTVPASVKAAALSMASRMMASPAGVRSETIAGYSVTYNDTGSAVRMTDAEMASLSWLRRRSVAA